MTAHVQIEPAYRDGRGPGDHSGTSPATNEGAAP